MTAVMYTAWILWGFILSPPAEGGTTWEMLARYDTLAQCERIREDRTHVWQTTDRKTAIREAQRVLQNHYVCLPIQFDGS